MNVITVGKGPLTAEDVCQVAMGAAVRLHADAVAAVHELVREMVTAKLTNEEENMGTSKEHDTEIHPLDTGPEYTDAEGRPAQLVCCPACGQMEWWTQGEVEDHGKCRAAAESCKVCAP